MASEKTYTVERRTVVAAPPERIRAEIDDLRRWQGWSPWEGLDADLQRTYTGPPSGPGAAYAWSGNKKAGRGRMEVRSSTPEAVAIDIVFEKPFPSTSTSTFSLLPSGGSTELVWSMVGPRPLVLRLLGPVISMDKIVGKDFERGLAQLKARAEAAPA
ncbi:SRPBCC family protein [Quadrisphaera sp. INWT6]|nr:SRPBCC family protein [Quadrisphaera sp. INWT6]